SRWIRGRRHPRCRDTSPPTSEPGQPAGRQEVPIFLLCHRENVTDLPQRFCHPPTNGRRQQSGLPGRKRRKRRAAHAVAPPCLTSHRSSSPTLRHQQFTTRVRGTADYPDPPPFFPCRRRRLATITPCRSWRKWMLPSNHCCTSITERARPGQRDV